MSSRIFRSSTEKFDPQHVHWNFDHPTPFEVPQGGQWIPVVDAAPTQTPNQFVAVQWGETNQRLGFKLFGRVHDTKSAFVTTIGRSTDLLKPVSRPWCGNLSDQVTVCSIITSHSGPSVLVWSNEMLTWLPPIKISQRFPDLRRACSSPAYAVQGQSEQVTAVFFVSDYLWPVWCTLHRTELEGRPLGNNKAMNNGKLNLQPISHSNVNGAKLQGTPRLPVQLCSQGDTLVCAFTIGSTVYWSVKQGVDLAWSHPEQFPGPVRGYGQPSLCVVGTQHVLVAIFRPLERGKVVWIKWQGDRWHIPRTFQDNLSRELNKTDQLACSVSVDPHHGVLACLFQPKPPRATVCGGIQFTSNANIVLGRNFDVEVESWMSNMVPRLSSRRLSEIAIPGTHQSGSMDITSSSKLGRDAATGIEKWATKRIAGSVVRHVVKNWAKCQNRTIAEQLRDGVRFFDFRVSYHPGTRQMKTDHIKSGPASSGSFSDTSVSREEFYLTHTLVSGPLSMYLQQIYDFLAEFQGEVTIVNLAHLYGMGEDIEAHEKLVNLIREIFCVTDGSSMLANSHDVFNQTYGELTDEGKSSRVVFLYNHAFGSSKYSDYLVKGGGDSIRSLWLRVANAQSMVSKLNKELLEHRTFHNEPNTSGATGQTATHATSFFHVFQCVLTPDTAAIVRGLHSSLEKFVRPATDRAVQWITNLESNSLNIAICDYYTVANQAFVAAVLRHNNNHYKTLTVTHQ